MSKEKRFVRKNPALVVISDVISSVQGEVAITEDVLVVTIGGIKLQSKNARVKPSRKANGSSVSGLGTGMTGIYSTIACINVYSTGTTPDIINEGGIPKKGAVIASPP